MQEVKYTFYLNSDDVEEAQYYLERIQRQLLNEKLVVGLREEVMAIEAGAVEELYASGEVCKLEDGTYVF